MKFINVLLLFLLVTNCFSQKKETIKIPKGVVYNYCDAKVVEEAKKLIADNLSINSDYKILQEYLIIGPELWKRFKDNDNIKKIEQGKVQFHVDDLILDGKMCQDLNDSKIIWDEFRKEVSQDFTIRKATEEELKYYWSVISFDIDEPLLIVETKEHNYILNLIKKDLKLMWLDEAPRLKKAENIEFKKYQNGAEIDSIPKGIKETKLEKVVLLSSDEELKENTSIEDLTSIIDKTNLLFEELFKNSEKSGKIMIEFELQKKNNTIQFAFKDDIDLDIMKEFEKRVKSEKYPNSKKKSVKLQLIYKVNSFNDED
jgi:hypothetical protein